MNSALVPTRLLSWPDGPLRIAFSVLAVFSAAGLFQFSAHLAVSPMVFSIAVLVLFAFEVFVFETGLKYVVVPSVSSAQGKGTGNHLAISDLRQLAQSIQVATMTTLQNRELVASQVLKQEELTSALRELKYSVDGLRRQLRAAVGATEQSPKRTTGILRVGGVPRTMEEEITARLENERGGAEKEQEKMIRRLWLQGSSPKDIAVQLSLSLRETEALLDRYFTRRRDPR
jgi:hypothetical protein